MAVQLSLQRWYYFEVYPRDWEEPEFRFVGKFLDENDGYEWVLQDQDGSLYYLRDIHKDIEIEGDLIAVRSEVVESGRTVEEVCDQLKEVWGNTTSNRKS